MNLERENCQLSVANSYGLSLEIRSENVNNSRENVSQAISPGWEPDAVVRGGGGRLVGGAAPHGDRGDESVIGAPGLAA